jgi:hypothetical protein
MADLRHEPHGHGHKYVDCARMCEKHISSQAAFCIDHGHSTHVPYAAWHAPIQPHIMWAHRTLTSRHGRYFLRFSVSFNVWRHPIAQKKQCPRAELAGFHTGRHQCCWRFLAYLAHGSYHLLLRLVMFMDLRRGLWLKSMSAYSDMAFVIIRVMCV